MKLEINIYLRIFLLALFIVDAYLIFLDTKNKWLVGLRYLILPIALVIIRYIFQKQKQKEFNPEHRESDNL